MAKFPDLNQDGKITQADILKGRGVYKKGGRVKKMAEGGSSVKPLPKGPQGRRRYPGQNEADKKRREAMQAVEDSDMSRKMQEAYERFGRSSESDSPGYKKGGAVKSSASKRADGIAVKGKTRGTIV